MKDFIVWEKLMKVVGLSWKRQTNDGIEGYGVNLQEISKNLEGIDKGNSEPDLLKSVHVLHL